MVIHVIVCIFLILTVLLQAGKGGGMGVAFGSGGGGTVLGAGGASTLLSKATVASAAIFMISSMSLAYLSSTTRSVLGDSVLETPEVLKAEEKAQEGAGAVEGATPVAPGDDKAPVDGKPPVEGGAAPVEGGQPLQGGVQDGPGAAIPGAVVKENPDGTGTVEFDLVPDPKTGDLKAVGPGQDLPVEEPAKDEAPVEAPK